MNAKTLVPEQDIPYAQDRDLFLLFSHIRLKIPINNERGELLYLSPLEKNNSSSGYSFIFLNVLPPTMDETVPCLRTSSYQNAMYM